MTDEQGNSRITMDDFAAAVVDELDYPQNIGRRMSVAY
jgi:putative NADH-flavin reductase